MRRIRFFVVLKKTMCVPLTATPSSLPRKLSKGDPRSQIPPALAPITPPLVELVTYWTGRVTPEGGALRIQRETGRNQNLEL